MAQITYCRYKHVCTVREDYMVYQVLPDTWSWLSWRQSLTDLAARGN